MNEWSPGGNYSRPGTPNQTGRPFRTQREEIEKTAKPLVVNIRAVSDNKGRSSVQQHSMEDVSTSSMPTSIKSMKVGTGICDPRFKRVISSGLQNDACVGTVEGKSAKASSGLEEVKKSRLPVWTAGEFKSNHWDDGLESKEVTKPTYNDLPPECENLTGADGSNVDQTQDHLKAVDKLAFNHDILMKSFSKESLSDCTVNTRNTSLASNDLAEEFSNNVTVLPSATRVKKVQNWIQEQKPKPEKKQSVITVIGQTQEQDTFSSALREIDKRRKLVKELDKYAVCKKIIDSDKEKEISNLVAKINGFSSSGRVIYSDGKSLESKETSKSLICSSVKGSGDNIDKHLKSYENEKILNSKNGFGADALPPVCLSQKPTSLRKKSKKFHLASEYPVKGKIRDFFNRLQYQWVFCMVVILSGAICCFSFFSLQKSSYVSFDLFTTKPKTMTWYEKICTWIWELFRPSANYHRTGPWNSY